MPANSSYLGTKNRENTFFGYVNILNIFFTNVHCLWIIFLWFFFAAFSPFVTQNFAELACLNYWIVLRLVYHVSCDEDSAQISSIGMFWLAFSNSCYLLFICTKIHNFIFIVNNPVQLILKNSSFARMFFIRSTCHFFLLKISN